MCVVYQISAWKTHQVFLIALIGLRIYLSLLVGLRAYLLVLSYRYHLVLFVIWAAVFVLKNTWWACSLGLIAVVINFLPRLNDIPFFFPFFWEFAQVTLSYFLLSYVAVQMSKICDIYKPSSPLFCFVSYTMAWWVNVCQNSLAAHLDSASILY